MKLMGVAFYEDGKYVKFIPVDENGKMEQSFHIFDEVKTTAFVMYAQDETACPPGTTIIQWLDIPKSKGLLH